MRLFVVGVYFVCVCQALQAQVFSFGDSLVLRGLGSANSALRASAGELQRLLEADSSDVDTAFEVSFVYEESTLSEDEWDESSSEGRLLNALYRLFDFTEEEAEEFNPDSLIEGRVYGLLSEDIYADLGQITYRELAVTASTPERLIEQIESLIQREKKRKGKQACEEDDEEEDEGSVDRAVVVGRGEIPLPIFPEEVWYQILLRSNVPDIVSFSEVCRSGYFLAHDDQLLGRGDEVCPDGFHTLSLKEQCLWAIRHDKWGMFRVLCSADQSTSYPEYFMEAMRSGNFFVVRFLLEQGTRLGALFSRVSLVRVHPYRLLANTTQEIRELVLAHEPLGVIHRALLNASELGKIPPEADLDAVDPYLGYSPLLLAVTLENMESIRSLCRDDRVSAQMRDSAACLAAGQGSLDVLVCLINEFSASAYGVDSRGLTPLHHAVYARSLPCVRFLADLGAVVLNAQGGQLAESALHMAARLGYVDVVDCLVEFDELDVNARNRNGAAPIHVAIFYDRDVVLRSLAAVPGVNWNLPDFRGDMPVHQAVRFGKMNTLSFLLLELEDGLVNLRLQNGLGYTPRGLAEAINNQVALSLLEEEGGDEEPAPRPSGSRMHRLLSAVRNRFSKTR